jgi:hypothetical protein
VTPRRARVGVTPLDVLVGEWSMEAVFPDDRGGGQVMRGGTSLFEWLKGKRLLVQRSTMPGSLVPDGVEIVAVPSRGTRYLQHYFDSRGVVRLYQMTFRGRVWTLQRDTADFSPLDFHQRFIGTVSADGNTIAGEWQTSDDGKAWTKDFDLIYRRTKKRAQATSSWAKRPSSRRAPARQTTGRAKKGPA